MFGPALLWPAAVQEPVSEGSQISPAGFIAADTLQELAPEFRATVEAARIRVLHVPFHTTEHVVYEVAPSAVPGQDSAPPLLFTGDALFLGGCGRMFEGSPEQLLAAMRRFAGMDPQTRLFTGHEYTLENAAFNRWLMPDSEAMQRAFTQAAADSAAGRSTQGETLQSQLQRNSLLLAARADAGLLQALRPQHHALTLEVAPTSDIPVQAAVATLESPAASPDATALAACMCVRALRDCNAHNGEFAFTP